MNKLTRSEKRKLLKRTKPEDDGMGDEPVEKKVDKTMIEQQIKTRDYDMTQHFGKRSALEIESGLKTRSYSIILGKKQRLTIFVSAPNKNQI